jgi:hypothetical protein
LDFVNIDKTPILSNQSKGFISMQIEEVLTNQYGPLLSVAMLAKVLDRSAEGLRISLRTDSEWSKPINAAKLKIGRRVYFRTAEIALVLSGK